MRFPAPEGLRVGGTPVRLGWAGVGEGGIEDLPAAEQALLPGRAVERRRAQFIAGRLAVRRALAHLGLEAMAVLRRPESAPDAGRPFVHGDVGGAPIGLSLAHSGSLACAAVARGAVLGVDLEAEALPVGAAFLEEAFAPGELEGFGSLAESFPGELVRVAWTLKEAALKVWGVGLRAPLGQVRLVPGAATREGQGVHFPVEVHVGPLPGNLPPPPRRLECVTVQVGEGALLSVALDAGGG